VTRIDPSVDRDRMIALLRRRGIDDEDVLRAFATVPREIFVDGDDPYADMAQPTASGQTVSQPFVQALMTAAVRPDSGFAGASALEIGTGSGYQAAILAELGVTVVSIERHPGLATRAIENLTRAGLDGRVEVRTGDGTLGCPDRAPFDMVLVTAAAPAVSPPLLAQLRDDDARLVAPIGSTRNQDLVLVTRRRGEDTTRRLCPVVFVPLLGEHGV